jgi:hypothetical protein
MKYTKELKTLGLSEKNFRKIVLLCNVHARAIYNQQKHEYDAKAMADEVAHELDRQDLSEDRTSYLWIISTQLCKEWGNNEQF